MNPDHFKNLEFQLSLDKGSRNMTSQENHVCDRFLEGLSTHNKKEVTMTKKSFPKKNLPYVILILTLVFKLAKFVAMCFEPSVTASEIIDSLENIVLTVLQLLALVLTDSRRKLWWKKLKLLIKKLAD